MGNFFSRQHFEMCFLYFSENGVLTETICMECQILFKGQNKTNVTNMSTSELAEIG